VDFLHQYLNHVVPKKDKTPIRMAPGCSAPVQNCFAATNERQWQRRKSADIDSFLLV
jgi:hypothetical protein